MSPLYEPTERLLAWWSLGYVSDEAVSVWVDHQIMVGEDDPPEWLLDLSIYGVTDYLRRRAAETPRPRELSFQEAFRAMAEKTKLDDAACRACMRWLIQTAIGEALTDAIVVEAYQIDHLYSDCGEEQAALERTRALLQRAKVDAHDIRLFFQELALPPEE